MIDPTSDPTLPEPPADDRGGLWACLPVPGPGRRPVQPLVVDGDLVWILRTPGVPLGVARPSAPRVLAAIPLDLDAEAAAAGSAAVGDLLPEAAVHSAARAVARCLENLPSLPDLPFIGEPFGGEEGTD